MQLGGNGQRVTATELITAMAQSTTLHRAFLNYGHAFFVQMGHTVLANGRSKLEDRLARWILMAHDRVDGDKLVLTHEFLAVMLGVRRAGVTVAVNLLQNRGLILADRGVITVVDRLGLEKSTDGAYGVPEAEFRRLFG